jgi:hypothetical protein
VENGHTADNIFELIESPEDTFRYEKQHANRLLELTLSTIYLVVF